MVHSQRQIRPTYIMLRYILTTFLVVFTLNLTYGCLNGESKELKSGILIYLDHEGNVPYGHLFVHDEAELNIELKKLDSLYITTKDLDYLSDKGIVYILLGQYEKAIELYLEIEKLEPNRYSTASNIGTAYELIGQNENALKWINRSIAIDSTSHNNSEWIHARILEAKINGEQFYTTTHLLNTDFGKEQLPISKLAKDELRELHSALYFQLNERISFIKPKDKIVAQLLLDLGDIAYLLGQYSDALGDYALAKEYGFEGQLIENRIKNFNRVNKDDHYLIIISIGAFSLIVIGLIVYKVKTRKIK